MRLKKIQIQIKSLDQALDEFVNTARRVEKRQKLKPKRATYVADPETARAIFTENRLKIVQFIKDKAPGSIYELAKALKRDFKNVYEDVSFLAEVGILRIQESRSGRRKKKPALLCENILIQIAA